MIYSWLVYQNSRPLASNPRLPIPSPLNPHTFSQKLNTSGVKTRPVLKNSWYLFQKLENVKSWYAKIIIICENNYSRNYFCKILNRRCLTGYWICQASEYTRALNVPLVLNMPRLWIYQGSEYTRFLSMPGSCIYEGSNMPGLHSILNMPE